MLLLDTGVLIAFVNAGDPRHDEALALVTDAQGGRFGRVITTDYILDELLTLIRVRSGRKAHAEAVIRLIRGAPTEGIPAVIGLRHIGERTVADAVDLFLRYFDQRLSFTDCVTVALSREDARLLVATFDGPLGRLVPKPEQPLAPGGARVAGQH